MSSKRVYWIEGDGIGPEIWRAARPVIDAALAKESDMRIEWVELLAGEKATAETGSPLPEETMNALRTADFAMKGPLGTPVGTGIRSLNVALRQTLDLYACIRPVRHFEGLETPVKHPERVNMVIFRENTEDVYAGIEYAARTPEAKKLIAFLREEFGVTKIREEAAVGIKPMSEFGSKRLVRRALRFALDTGSKSLTLVHKGNIMKFTEGGFRQWGYDVAAQEFGDLTCRRSPWKGVWWSRTASPTPCSRRPCCVPNSTRSWPPPISTATTSPMPWPRRWAVWAWPRASTCPIPWPSMKPPTAPLPPSPARTRPTPAA